MRPKLLVLLLISPIAACAGATKSPAPQRQPIPAQYQSTISMAETLGRAIYEYDQAAWVASDALLAKFPEARSKVNGWIVVPGSTEWNISFISHGIHDGLAAYRVTLDGKFKTIGVLEHDPPIPLPPDQHVMYKARQLALQSTDRTCPTDYNSVVLPATLIGDVGWLVYLLPASTVPGEAYLGHHRVLVDQDGTSIVRTEALSKSCLRSPPPPDNATAAWVTHLTSPTPIETHVLRNLATGKPLYVAAGGDLWLVENGTIAYFGPLKR